MMMDAFILVGPAGIGHLTLFSIRSVSLHSFRITLRESDELEFIFIQARYDP